MLFTKSAPRQALQKIIKVRGNMKPRHLPSIPSFIYGYSPLDLYSVWGIIPHCAVFFNSGLVAESTASGFAKIHKSSGKYEPEAPAVDTKFHIRLFSFGSVFAMGNYTALCSVFQ